MKVVVVREEGLGKRRVENVAAVVVSDAAFGESLVAEHVLLDVLCANCLLEYYGTLLCFLGVLFFECLKLCCLLKYFHN